MKNETFSKRYNSQYSKAYIVYMILGSYFDDSVCGNELEAEHLYLHYKEMPNNKQLREEKDLIDFFEHRYKSLIPQISELKCDVSLRKSGKNYYVCFETGLDRVSVVVDPEGKYDILASVA